MQTHKHCCCCLLLSSMVRHSRLKLVQDCCPHLDNYGDEGGHGSIRGRLPGIILVPVVRKVGHQLSCNLSTPWRQQQQHQHQRNSQLGGNVVDAVRCQAEGQAVNCCQHCYVYGIEAAQAGLGYNSSIFISKLLATATGTHCLQVWVLVVTRQLVCAVWHID